ncbi:hypothetical protein NM688_g2413 [Phlebia brevispora]|uniref:Uncharacterized protein n=1 Tax=Phlebia brevispora TaxID=194682 RepID=A0ACC1T8S2_9APHY|nr:hypothetical protein NM688_g2413 [Phlebia brevispora]
MGVKSLWNLLDPVGRPVLLETMEGKAMAIDSSIWIYQFQATMRDKEGRGLVNAHVLGFLRRICKLLFYGIKPVFVFDGGAPALKKTTIAERKNKKSGAAASHVKVAERILAAQMRREALTHALAQTSQVPKPKPGIISGPAIIDENTVYLEDVEGNAPQTPAKKVAKEPEQSPPSAKKSRWHDYDPYKLPDVDLDVAVSRATHGNVPDPRLATEDELRAFIEEMRPEDFDVTSPAFRELPTEVHIGQAHVEIPIRIASERNKQYLLIKNEGEEGGWILGVRDEGSRAKPIEIDQDHKPVQAVENDDSDSDMEEVEIEAPPVDPDLRDYRRNQALTALANRYSPKKLAPLTTKPIVRKKAKPLFAPEPGEDEPMASDFDADMSIAIQESLEEEEANDLRRAIEASKADASTSIDHIAGSNMGASTSRSTLDSMALTTPRKPSVPNVTTLQSDSDDDLYASPTRLETALSIANAGPKRSPTHVTKPSSSAVDYDFGIPVLLMPDEPPAAPENNGPAPSIESEDDVVEVSVPQPATPLPKETTLVTPVSDINGASDSDDDMEPVIAASRLPGHSVQATSPSPSDRDVWPKVAPAVEARAAAGRTPRISPVPLETQTISSDSEPESEADWSKAASPAVGDEEPRVQDDAHEDFDAAHEIDPQAEEGEFARFVSQVKGKNLDEVRREIDDEIRVLNQQKKVAMRDSEDVTQQMVSQIMMMLRLFGIPYITAPMEAEAQCAELLSLGLVDGIITDDSDVFLFGGARVLRNMFNQSKTVECFLLSDLERELSLDREKLVRLAYLLGSDYTDGLPGVGPVVAMELLTEFSGSDGLHRFREWWRKVQSGRDTAEDNKSKFRKRFKKRFKELFLSEDWPNPAVRDAYYHPTVDSSEESFKWGLPDLDALRGLVADLITAAFPQLIAQFI